MKKFIFTLMLAVGTFSAEHMSASNCMMSFPDTLNLNLGFSSGLFPPPGGWDNGDQGRGPEVQVSLPLCINTGYTLLFIGTGEVSLTYSVVDEYEYEWVRGTLSLSNGEEEPVDVSALPAGTYTLILGIAGREYEGEFTIE